MAKTVYYLQTPLFGSTADRNPLSRSKPEGSWGVNFGGGVNSSALLLYLHDKGIRPDWVLFSDTGSERPETYENVKAVGAWAKRVDFPFDIVRWVRKSGEFESVHDNALRTSFLPSKAYGHAGCTYKWKIQPMERWRKERGFEVSTVAIGYDAGEVARVRRVQKACASGEFDPSLKFLWYPLVAWGIDRAECEARLKQEGWPVVKSSCFLCPNMRAEEWTSLKLGHPDLFKIAQEVETRAKAAGHADSVSLFRQAGEDCLCSADGTNG